MKVSLPTLSNKFAGVERGEFGTTLQSGEGCTGHILPGHSGQGAFRANLNTYFQLRRHTLYDDYYF